jgi:putative hemolysin
MTPWAVPPLRSAGSLWRTHNWTLELFLSCLRLKDRRKPITHDREEKDVKHWMVFIGILLFVGALLVAACGSTPVPTAQPGQAGLPNPASVYCEEHGGKLDIRQDAQGGQYGVCMFDDGSECDEWAFYRGECQPGQMDHAPEPQTTP